MTMQDIHPVQFVNASPGARSAVEHIPLPFVNGRPPKILTDPTGAHRGEWRLVEQGESDVLVYQLLAPETAHP